MAHAEASKLGPAITEPPVTETPYSVRPYTLIESKTVGIISQLVTSLKVDRNIKQTFVLICCGVVVLFYFILEAFLRPLFWAVLYGTVLYPLKDSLTRLCRSWLNGLKDTGTPVILGTLLVPIWCINHVKDMLIEFVQERWKALLVFAGFVILHVFYPSFYPMSFVGMVILGHAWTVISLALDCFGTAWVRV